MSKSLIYNNYIKFVRIYYIVNHIVSLLVAIIGIFEIVDDQSDPNFCKTKYDAYLRHRGWILDDCISWVHVTTHINYKVNKTGSKFYRYITTI